MICSCCGKLSNHLLIPDIVSYIKTTYMPFETEFATYATRKYRNFGIQSTSRTESSHAELKRYLKNRLVDLKGLLEAIQTTMTKKRERFESQLAKEKATRFPKHIRVTILNPLCLKVSTAALEKIYQQYLYANEFFTKKLPRSTMRRCTHQFRMQMGLPCAHTVLNRLESQEPFSLEDIDLHWHIEAS